MFKVHHHDSDFNFMLKHMSTHCVCSHTKKNQFCLGINQLIIKFVTMKQFKMCELLTLPTPSGLNA
jgi:hypothetical protein